MVLAFCRRRLAFPFCEYLLVGIRKLALLFIGLPFALGLWQVQRLFWKQDLLQKLEEPALTHWHDKEDVAYRPVQLRGTFLNEEAHLLSHKPLEGQNGSYIVTPFQLDSGTVVLVNRGWTPEAKEPTPTRKTTVKGILMKALPPSYWTPKNDKGHFYWIEPALMTPQPLYSKAYYILSQDDDALHSVPLKIANNHLIYALTWFALSAIMGYIYITRKV